MKAYSINLVASVSEKPSKEILEKVDHSVY